MRKPLNTSIPEEMIAQVDQTVAQARGSFRDRSHFVEQAIRAFLQNDLGVDPAVPPAPALAGSLYETSLFPRMSVNRAEKQAIARAAAGRIRPGMTLFIDGSTTCIELARILAHQKKHLTVVTNSTLICLELGRTREHQVICAGGDFDASSASFTGPVCEEAARTYYVDLALLSTKGFIPQDGTFESNTGTLRIKQIFARNTRQVALLVDHSKFHQKSLQKVLDIDQIQAVITDAEAPADALEELARRGVEVVVSTAQKGR